MSDNEIHNTLDAHELRLDTQRNRLDAQVERLKKLEERLAAIEQATEPPRLGDAFPIPSTAERESGPTPGMVAAARSISEKSTVACYGRALEEINRHVGPELSALRAENEHLRYAISQYNLCCEQFNIGKLATDDGDSLFEAMCRMEQQLDTLRAENERLKSKLADAELKAVSATEHHHFYRDKVSDYVGNEVKLNAAITTLTRERDEARERFDEVCVEIRKIEYGQGMSPVGCLRRIATQLATAREAAEAIEAIRKFNYTHLSKRPRGDWQAQFGSGHPGYGPTPTAAILAAKAASGTKKGVE